MSFVRSLAGLRRRPPDSHPTWLIAGLGNPGAQYAKTRHNIGFMCLNRIAHRHGARFRSSGPERADTAGVSITGVSVILAQPQTYMNESGRALSRILRRRDLHPDRALLIYDDVDLPFGTVRVREGGSAGGHRGVQSVIDSLRTQEIPRIRVGIGRGSGSTKDYVLTEFSPAERSRILSLCDHVADVVESVVVDGVAATMNRFNGQAAPELTAG